jgi:hypothetical protein
MPIPRPDTRRAPPPPKRMLPMDDLDELVTARAPAKPSTDMAAGMGAKKPVTKVVTDREKERRDAYEQDQRDQAASAGQGDGVQYDGGADDDRDKQDKLVEAEYDKREKADGVDGGDDLDELAQQRQAASDEIDAKNAQAAMDQRSRAGLGGLGLSGAASAAEGDLARQQGRTKTLTMQEFDQAAEDQNFTEIQRRAALDDLEDAADIDYDGDGMVAGVKVDEAAGVGDGNPENDVDTVGATGLDAQKEALAAQNEIYSSDDYSLWDTDAQPGSVQEPYKYRGGKDSLERMLSEIAPGALPLTKSEQDTGNPLDPKRVVYTDAFGNSYVLGDDKTRRG